MQENEVFEQGCRHFDEGDYFEAHEVWEEIWVESSGPLRYYLQGLIQTAVALYHAGNENWKGTRKMLASALDYLEKGASACTQVDLEQLKDHILDFELGVQQRLKGESNELPFFKLPRV